MALQFDQQRIAIRERSAVEIFDLALAVLRERGISLLFAWGVGALPLLLLNFYLFQDWLHNLDPDDFDSKLSYLYWSLMLMVFFTPWATAPMTIYLGRTMFQEHPTAGEIAGDFRRAVPQLLWYQLFLRGLWMAPLITAWLPYVIYPYLNEIILLEKNPLRSRPQHAMTTARRSAEVHGKDRGMCFGRWLGGVAFGTVMTFMLFFAAWGLLSTLLGYWISDERSYLLLWPLALYCVAGYFTIVRFLSYLDLRIRHEGWEVALLMRAEAARLSRQVA